jgi:Holliday junction resolvase
MDKSEAKIQKEIIDYLEDKGHYVIKIVRANKRGVADLAICHDGKFIAIEVKKKGKERNLTHLQRYHLQLVQNSGGKAFVASSIEDLKKEGL